MPRSLFRTLRRLTKSGRREAYVASVPARLGTEWEDLPLRPGNGGLSDVACRECPKFSRWPRPRCTVPMGSRIRSCICAAAEYNLRDAVGAEALEIGCAERSFGREIIEARGGRWTSVDPNPEVKGRHSIRTHVGHAADLPFPDESFDVVFGIQTLEHWEDPLAPLDGCNYRSAMREIRRVLRPGGWFYLDAPIHLHGAPEFVRGDLPAIRRIFETEPWFDLRMTAWRRQHEPLRPFRPPPKETRRWPRAFPDFTRQEREHLAARSVWLLTIRGTRPFDG